MACITNVFYTQVGTQIQAQVHKAPETKMHVAQALETARSMMVFSGFAAWPRMMLTAGLPTALVFDWQDMIKLGETTLWMYALKMVLITFLVDFYMYFKHRLLHSRPLYMFHRYGKCPVSL
jgi:sterol desaturase/sphingolipid hydroxylase (fatty acid hydroxylase superfamily)